MDENKYTLMIVEDDFFLRELYEDQAQLEGFNTITAEDGETALVLLQNQKPDLVLLDLMLPKIDGTTVANTIKENPDLHDIPVIIITNLEDRKKEKELRELGVSDYILKIRNTPKMVINKAREYLPA